MRAGRRVKRSRRSFWYGVRASGLLEKVVVVAVAGLLVAGALAVAGPGPITGTAVPDAATTERDPFQPPDWLVEDISAIYLRRFTLQHVRAPQLEPLISAMGINIYSVTLSANPRAIWVRGDAASIAQVRDLIASVDIPDNQEIDLDAIPLSLEYGVLTTYHIAPERLLEVLADLGMEASRYVIINRHVLIFDEEMLERWDDLQELVLQIDTSGVRDMTVFIYHLRNVAAADAATRLGAMGYDNTNTLTFSYDQLSRDLMVICPPSLREEVVETLSIIDSPLRTIRVPIAHERGPLAVLRLQARRALLSDLSGVSTSRMEISQNLSGDPADPWHVLWVEESPEMIPLLEYLLTRIGN